MSGPNLTDTSYLKPVDVGQLRKELRVAARAAQRTDVKNPSSLGEDDARFLGDLASRLGAEARTAATDTSKRLTHISDLVSQLGAHVDFEKVRNETETDLNDMSVASTRAHGDIKEALKLYQEQKDHFQEYREHRGLRRPAAAPPHVFGQTWMLYVFGATEAILNMFFFAGGNALGFLGGLIFALLVASLNIIAAFLVGFSVTKWLNSIYLAKKVIGGVACLVFFGGLTASHLMVAHFRAQQMLAGESGEFASGSVYFDRALDRFSANPILLPDIESYVLLGFGIIFGLFAWWKGYHFGDPYPGYTKQFGALQNRRLDFEAEYHRLLDMLEDVRDRVRDRISAFIDSIGPSVRMMKSNASEAEALVGHYETFLNSIDGAYRIVSHEYCNAAGIDAQDDELEKYAGSYFDHKLEFADGVARLRREASEASQLADGVKQEASEYRRQIIARIGETEMAARAAAEGLDGALS